LHGMAYYIFLKSLTSQEEFRKNPHVKIPPKSPCANFQSHGIFKNQILFRKEFFPSLLAHPAFQPSLFFSGRISLPSPTGSRPPGRPSPPHGPIGHLLPPPTLTPGAHGATVGRPRAASTVTRRLHRKERKQSHQSPSFPPLLDTISPLQ
jgi:hypothetical protein